jgi:hypothetical protein
MGARRSVVARAHEATWSGSGESTHIGGIGVANDEIIGISECT